MRWLGLDDWDEGPDVGGPFAPYRQSERSEIYADALARLKESSRTYDCYCTNDEVEARRKASGSKLQGYDGFCRELTDDQVAAFRAEGREPVVRFRMPDGEITFDDLVRGDITFHTDHVPDFALARANGQPLYTLVNPVDDALMEITHVLRGEDLLSSTPRQIALYDALERGRDREGHPAVRSPALRDGRGQQEALQARPRGPPDRLPRATASCPRACSTTSPCSAGRSPRTATCSRCEEMVEAFDIARVNPNPARFDLKKAEAINAAHMRLLSLEEMTERVTPYLQREGVLDDPVTGRPGRPAGPGDAAGARAHQQAHRGGPDARASCSPTRCAYDAADVAKVLDDEGLKVVDGGPRRPRRDRGLDDRAHRGGTPPRAGRRARAQAAQRLRPGARGRHRSPGLAAALRVARAARPRGVAGPARRGSRAPRRAGVTQQSQYPGWIWTDRGLAARPGRPGAVAAATGPTSSGSAAGAPAPRAARLPADAAHLGLRLVAPGRRDPGVFIVGRAVHRAGVLIPVLAVAVAVQGGTGPLVDRVARLGHARERHAGVDALPQPDARVADAGGVR